MYVLYIKLLFSSSCKEMLASGNTTTTETLISSLDSAISLKTAQQ